MSSVQVLTGQPAPGEVPVVATLEQIRAGISARNHSDKANWRPFFHEGLKATVMLGPMSSEGYFAVENVAQYGPPGTPMQGQRISSSQADAMNRDVAFMMYGIMEPRLTRDDAVALWKQDGCGPANRHMVAQIATLNPPREVLVTEVRASVAMSRMTLVFYRLLREAGALTKLRDWVLGEGTDAEREALATDLNKWEAALVPFEALLEADEAAKAFDIGVYARDHQV